MLQLLLTIAVVAVLNNRTIVMSESPPFCGDTTYRSTCPGDDQVEIMYPFWIDNRTADENGNCISYAGFQITCAANGRPVISISNNLYYVLNISYYGITSLTVTEEVIDAQECPQPRRNISLESVPFFDSKANQIINMNIFYNCSGYPHNMVQHMPCLDYYYNNFTGRAFAFSDEEISINGFNWYQNCFENVVVPISGDLTKMNYTQALKGGIHLNWRNPLNCRNCEISGGNCWANETNQAIGSTFHCNCTHGKRTTLLVDQICNPSFESSNDLLFTIVKLTLLGAGPLVLVLLLIIFRRYCYSLYNCCRKVIKSPTNVEVFLENNYGGLSLQNYKYSDIKKLTNSLKNTLGQGGYGSVFKGKLCNGRLVAVKVLNESKGKEEDFINEVATIGRTNHVNVVRLLGFCAEGTKRALVYEFMPNGSLEKFIHNAKDLNTTSSFLGWEKLYQIALGIARGLEYLHRDCNTRILHFDIKPHNILLDQNFCPKISDFGLAKLCPTRDSLVSMVGARGTIGYIAPEVCCRNFGGVSHKSDVYSYGMMVLEMIGGRKNIDATVENISEIYFPQWIYRRLRDDVEVEGSEKRKVVVCGEVFAEDVTQKMIIVALWCIQAHPGDRPSITKVVDMLEGNTEDLQLPPNPFPDPSSKPFSSSS